MAKTILSTTRTDNNAGTTTAGATEFWYCGYAPIVANTTTESQREITYRAAGTISKLYVRVLSNSTSANSTLTLRKNAADTALTVTITAGTNGVYEDASDSISVAAGDKLCWKSVSGGTGTLTFALISAIYDSTSNCSVRYVTEGYAVTSASATHFLPIAGNRSGTTTSEANVENTIKTAGTAKNFFVNVTANARTTNTTFTLRKNRADTAVVFTYGSGATGIQEVTATTVSYAVDDELDWEITSGTGTQTLTFQCIAMDYETTSQGVFTRGNVGSTADVTHAFNTTRFFALGGGAIEGVSTEADAQMLAREAFTFRNLIFYTNTNTMAGGTSTFDLRVNGASSALTASLTANGTGFFSDTTNSVTVAAGDLICFRFTNNSVSGSISLRQLGLTADAPAGVTRNTATLTLINNILQRNTGTLTIRNDIRQRNTGTLTLRNDIKQRFTGTLTIRNNIIQRLASTLTLRNNIFQRLSSTLTIRNNILQRFATTLTFRNNILQRNTTTLTLRNNIIARLISTLTLIDRILQRNTSTLILRNNILQRFATTLTIRNNILQRFITTLTLRNTLLGRSIATLSLINNIIERKSSTLTIRNNILQRFATSLTLLNNIIERKTTTLTLINNVQSAVTRLTATLTLRNNILARSIATLTIRNDIQQRLTSALTIVNNILERRTTTLTIRNDILQRLLSELILINSILERKEASLTIINDIESGIARLVATLTLINNLEGAPVQIEGGGASGGGPGITRRPRGRPRNRQKLLTQPPRPIGVAIIFLKSRVSVIVPVLILHSKKKIQIKLIRMPIIVRYASLPTRETPKPERRIFDGGKSYCMLKGASLLIQTKGTFKARKLNKSVNVDDLVKWEKLRKIIKLFKMYNTLE